MSRTTDSIDFLPERIRLQRERRRRLRRQGYLVAACLIGLACLAHARQDRVRRARAEVAALDDNAAKVRRQMDLRDALERQQADLMIKRRISDRLGSRINALDVLAELQRVLPESMALTHLGLEAMEVRVPVQPAGETTFDRSRAVPARKARTRATNRVRLVLTGLAPTDVDVANFIGQLSASPLFEDVNMGYAKNVTFRKRLAREFQTSCYVVR